MLMIFDLTAPTKRRNWPTFDDKGGSRKEIYAKDGLKITWSGGLGHGGSSSHESPLLSIAADIGNFCKSIGAGPEFSAQDGIFFHNYDRLGCPLPRPQDLCGRGMHHRGRLGRPANRAFGWSWCRRCPRQLLFILGRQNRPRCRPHGLL